MAGPFNLPQQKMEAKINAAWKLRVQQLDTGDDELHFKAHIWQIDPLKNPRGMNWTLDRHFRVSTNVPGAADAIKDEIAAIFDEIEDEFTLYVVEW